MKLKGFLASLSPPLQARKQAKDRHGKRVQDPDTAAAASHVGPELDELGLEPPPSNLLAPWAKKKPQHQEDESSKPSVTPEPSEAKSREDSMQKEEKPQDQGSTIPASSTKPAETSNAKAAHQMHGNANNVPKQESEVSKQITQVTDTPDTTLDYILGNTDPARKASIASPSEQSPEQTERSSGLASDSSLIQAKPSLPPHIQMDRFLQREPSAAYTSSDSESGTPVSNDGLWHLDSRVSSGTVVVIHGHNAKPSLTFTASIEDYAKKADPSTWEPAKFRKSQIVRIQPGIYPVPYKKLSESHSQYTKLNSYVKGTIHQIHSSMNNRDPREFVTDEGLVMYRVFVLRRLTTNVEFIFVTEDQMTAFNECAHCNAFASQRCTGCDKEWYCSDHCASADWKTHKQDCKHKGKTAPAFGPVSASEESQTGENPGLAALPPKAPRREFRTDGTVKIINGYKPDPSMFRGSTTVLPLCLRPLTLDEEIAPPPESRVGRMWRNASHNLRRRIYREKMAKVKAIMEEQDAPAEEVEYEENEAAGSGQASDVPQNPERKGMVVEMTADATLQGASAILKQEESLIGEALEEVPELTGRKDGSGMFGANCHNSPNSEKSAESLVEGAPHFASSQGLQAIMNQHSTASMPDLPRIRVRQQTPLQKAKSGVSLSNRAKKPLSKLSTAMSAGTNAKDVPVPPKNLAEPLPEVFSRVADGAKFNMESLDGTERSRVDAPSESSIA